jgi:trehalose/maltose hydrolase-like predicted phosphorylase
MNKKIIIISIVLIIVVIGLSVSQDDKKNSSVVFHVTLADPNLYKNGVYSNTFTVNKGDYTFKFVPNGDSPEYLTILLNGENFKFSENFELNGTLHQTGISEYYTWDYDGQKTISIPSQQLVSIEINPNGNEMGPVSVDIIEN